MMKRKYYKYRTPNNWETYRTHRNMVVNMRRDCERTETCSKSGGGKDFWKCIKPLISNKNKSKNNDIILKEGENVINNATEVCTLMNEYYVNITQCIGIDNFNDIIDTHSNNESVLYIKENIRTQNVSAPRFVFKQVSNDQVLDKI